MLTAERRTREKAMIDDPMKWPLLVLPMKNLEERDKTGFPPIGFLRAGMEWDTTERVLHLGSIHTIGDTKADHTNTITFKDTDALLDAGWVVD